MHPFGIPFGPSPTGHGEAVGIDVDAGHTYPDPPSIAPPGQNPQVVSTTTADLANVYPKPVPGQPSKTGDADRMTAQPGIDHIQLPHIPLDIAKGNTAAVEQFFFMAAMGEIRLSRHSTTLDRFTDEGFHGKTRA